MDIEEIIQKIVDNGKVEDMKSLSDILENTMEELEKYDEDCFDEYMMELYKMAYGNTLNKEMAEDIVYKMKPYGEKWDIKEVQRIMEQYEIDNIRLADFYVVINSAYNDYRDLFQDDIEKYVRFTINFIEDEDAKMDKVFIYFTKIPQ
jgi:chaperonin cofactor prefoldin